MFYPLNALTSPGVDDQQHFVPPLSPLFGASTTTGAGGATMAAMAAAMQLSNKLVIRLKKCLNIFSDKLIFLREYFTFSFT